MDGYRPVPFQEILEQMSEDDRLELEERWKVLRVEEAFWDSLPEAERNKRIEKPKVSYDPETDTLWLKNGRPAARHCDIVEGRVTAYFEAAIWYPSAVKIAGAYELLAGFFRPGDAPVKRWPVVQYGENGVIEKALQVDNLEIRYTIVSDYLWIGNGEPAAGGREIAWELAVSYDEDDYNPVGVLLNPAAKILTPVFSQICSSKPACLA